MVGVLGDTTAFLAWVAGRLTHTTLAGWWHAHGARLLNGVTISASGVLLAAVVVCIWQWNARRATRPGLAAQRLLWLLLLLGLFGGSSAIFASTLLPSRAGNVRRLAATVATLRSPVYTDQFTAGELDYLLRYHDANVHNAGSLDDHTMKTLLANRTGCILIHEPELDQLANDGLRVSPAAYALLRRQPAGWSVVVAFPSVENPLEHVAVVCARSGRRVAGSDGEQHGRHPA
jgi:hypothetical protein